MNRRAISENNLHRISCRPPIDAFRIAQEYRHGFTLHDIADARGLTLADIRRALKRCGVRVREN